MSGAVGALQLLLYRQFRYPGKGFIVPRHNLFSPFAEHGQFLQLTDEQCCLHIGHPVVVSQADHLVIPAPL